MPATNAPSAYALETSHTDASGHALATNICCHYAARDLRQAGFRVLVVQDASAGIDVPAAGLYQDKAKKEGLQMGIEYVSLQEMKYDTTS